MRLVFDPNALEDLRFRSTLSPLARGEDKRIIRYRSVPGFACAIIPSLDAEAADAAIPRASLSAWSPVTLAKVRECAGITLL